MCPLGRVPQKNVTTVVSKNSSQIRRVPFVTQNQNFLIKGDIGVHSGKKSWPGVWTSTMLFKSKMCVTWISKLNDTKFELQVQFL